MRGFLVFCCAAACADLALAEEDRLEFSGLTSPCDEQAGDQEDTLATMHETNDDLTDQLVALQQRVESELLTYGDTTNICSASFCTIGGGQSNMIDEDSVFSFIRGGKANWCYEHSPYSAISGGQSNVATGDYCSVGGGIKNKCYSNYAAIGGGFKNIANARFATVVGGSKNSAQGRYSLVGGYLGIASADNSAVFGLTDDVAGCENTNENSVLVCADHFMINGDDYIDSFSSARRLKEDSIDCKRPDDASDELRLEAYEAVVAALTELLK